jgi:ATP-dependent Clp protease ATP-binding subunit ClpA
LAILTVLAERLGEVVSNREFEAQLWPNTYVSDATLRVHINALQKALGLTEHGQRFIENLSRRGYRMTVPVRRRAAEPLALETSDQGKRPAPVLSGATSRSLPSPLIGRADRIARVVAILRERPLTAAPGAGGVGKTSVAMDVARELWADYPEGIWAVDFAAVAAAPEVGGAMVATEREELTRLRIENLRLREEREILAKAAAWFATEGSGWKRSSDS